MVAEACHGQVETIVHVCLRSLIRSQRLPNPYADSPLPNVDDDK
jgi:hypothetical protein